MKRQALRSPTLVFRRCLPKTTSGISPAFAELSPTSWQITHVLRTLAPLQLAYIAAGKLAFDLHVLSTPPAFVLSQNQTLRRESFDSILGASFQTFRSFRNFQDIRNSLTLVFIDYTQRGPLQDPLQGLFTYRTIQFSKNSTLSLR